MNITLKDGSLKRYSEGVTAGKIAFDVSPQFKKKAIGAIFNEVLIDLMTPINSSGTLDILTLEDPKSVSILHHSSAHVMAFAIQKLYPKVKFAIGPAIESGFYYDFDGVQLKSGNFLAIEKEMEKIISNNLPFSRHEISRKEAMSFFKKEPYKVEILKNLLEKKVITYYKMGDFIDLCKGPHLPHTGYIKAFKLLKLAGAYWRGKSSNPMLVRLYATSFSKKQQLDDYLQKRKKAEENDHVKVGKEMGLFFTDEMIGQGLPLLTPKGAVLKNILVQFVEEEERRRGYLYTATPFLAKSDLYKISRHWNLYKESMFILEEEKMALRPMTCPFHFAIYNTNKHSYRELPIRYAETSFLFRNESSGEMHGLTRIRQFTLSDGHIICRLDQLEKEFGDSLDLIQFILKTLDLNDYSYRFSKWDPNERSKYIDDQMTWEKTQTIMRDILNKKKLTFEEAKGEAAFYGPKLDIQMKNVYGKEDTIMTVQIDFALPPRFNMTYINEDGKEKHPVVIHRSSIGCYERTIALLIEKYGGKFPFWMAPEQIAILTVSKKFDSYAKELFQDFLNHRLRPVIDLREETLKKKIRDAQLSKIPCFLIIGEKEASNQTVSLRMPSGKQIFDLKKYFFIKECCKMVIDRSIDPSFNV